MNSETRVLVPIISLVVVLLGPVAAFADEEPGLVVGNYVSRFVSHRQALPTWVKVLVRADIDLLGPDKREPHSHRREVVSANVELLGDRAKVHR